MRMRKKPWARPELEAWDRFVQNPREKIGKWQEFFGNSNPIHIELGCGKGGFISKIAPMHPEINYIAIDLKDEVLGLAKRKLVAEYEALGVPQTNIALMAHDIERLNSMLLTSEKIDRIYINFCNPWSEKERHEKHRLTHTKQLLLYRQFLSPNAEIHFKTDSDVLFEDSLAYFKEAGFDIKYLTHDLHESGYENNIVTEHEQMYTEQGIKIKFLIANMI